MKIWKLETLGLIFTAIVGTLLHFVYDWSGQKIWVALFSPVNESTWEHLKLLATPFLIWTLVEFFLSKSPLPNLAFSKLIGLLVGMGVIITVFYTYSGILGKNLMFMDIAIFFLGVAAAYWVSFQMLQKSILSTRPAVTRWGVIGILILIVLFVWFTFTPSHIGLFVDPITAGFGIPAP
ncbi:MAG: DUF6512 family protein [Massiliimalia sp.]|jgi:hypothetical protein